MERQDTSDGEQKVLSLFEPYVQEWIRRSFDRLTPPQIRAWPLIAQGRNTLIFSPTGSGKTLAAFLWCINDLFRRGMESSLEEGVHVPAGSEVDGGIVSSQAELAAARRAVLVPGCSLSDMKGGRPRRLAGMGTGGATPPRKGGGRVHAGSRA